MIYHLNELTVMTEKVVVVLEGGCGDFVTMNFDSIDKQMINKTLSVYGIELSEDQLSEYCY